MHSIKLTLFWQEWENSYSQQDGEEGVEGKIKKICNKQLLMGLGDPKEH